jgi:hypothetical protein
MPELCHTDSITATSSDIAAWLLRRDFLNLTAYNPAVHRVTQISSTEQSAPLFHQSPQMPDRYELELELDDVFGAITCRLVVTSSEPYRRIVNTITVDGAEITAIETFTVTRSDMVSHAGSVADIGDIGASYDRSHREPSEPELLLRLSTSTSLPNGFPAKVVASLERSGREHVRTELENMKRLLEAGDTSHLA